MTIDLHKPIAWFGDDRMMLDDVTKHGLHRLVIARKGGAPDFEPYFDLATKQAKGAKVLHFVSKRDDYWLLWFLWKESL